VSGGLVECDVQYSTLAASHSLDRRCALKDAAPPGAQQATSNARQPPTSNAFIMTLLFHLGTTQKVLRAENLVKGVARGCCNKQLEQSEWCGREMRDVLWA